MGKPSLSIYIQLLAILTIFLFITAGAGCSSGDATSSDLLSISDVKASNTAETTAVISWNTDVPATSEVLYDCSTRGDNLDTLLDEESDILLDEKLVTSHSVTLRELDPDTTYYYKVRSRDYAGNEAESEDRTFTTSAQADTHAPVISEIAISEITESGATISWVTDEPATSLVEYGISDEDAQISDLLTELVTNHLIVLTKLEPDITYHFRILSTDDEGNEAVSEDFSLTTSPDIDTTAPVISSHDSYIAGSLATITWVTDEPASSQLVYLCT